MVKNTVGGNKAKSKARKNLEKKIKLLNENANIDWVFCTNRNSATSPLCAF